MRAKLVSREHGEFPFGDEATIGRAAGSTVRLEVSVISSQHARISFDPERSAYVLEDLDSLNGTELDGALIDREEVLGKLHLVRFGGSEEFIFQLVSAEAGAQTLDSPPISTTPGAAAPDSEDDGGRGAGKGDETGAAQIERDVVPRPDVPARAGAADAPSAAPITESRGCLALEIELDEGPVRFTLREGENVVGRSKTSDIQLDLSELSRRHAILSVAGREVRVRDEGSRNHTFIDGDLVEFETVAPIGAQIILGRVIATLVEVAAETETETGIGEPDTQAASRRSE